MSKLFVASVFTVWCSFLAITKLCRCVTLLSEYLSIVTEEKPLAVSFTTVWGNCESMCVSVISILGLIVHVILALCMSVCLFVLFVSWVHVCKLNLLHEADDDAVIWLEATATAALAKWNLCLCLRFLLTYLLPFRIDPLCFQAGGHRRQPNLVLHSFEFIFCCSSIVFFVFVTASPGFHFFSVLAKRLAGKSVSEMT